MSKSSPKCPDGEPRVAVRPAPASQRCGHGLAWEIVQIVLALAALAPCFIIVVLASFDKNAAWAQWLDKLNRRMTFGNSSRSGHPMAVWKGHGVADFGTVKVFDYDPVTRVSTEIQFKMEATTAFPEKGEFDAFMSRSGHTIQDELLVTLRSSTPGERNDHDYLGKKVVARVNRLLGREVLREVRISDLTTAEYIAETEN